MSHEKNVVQLGKYTRIDSCALRRISAMIWKLEIADVYLRPDLAIAVVAIDTEPERLCGLRSELLGRFRKGIQRSRLLQELQGCVSEVCPAPPEHDDIDVELVHESC